MTAVLAATGLLGLAGCVTGPARVASQEAAIPGALPQAAADAALPVWHGKKLPVVVLPLGLSASAAERYPRLREMAVGFGVHNMLVDTLYETAGFTFIEEKPEVIEEMLKRQWADAAGVVSHATAIEQGHLTGARYIVYGEVYDFGVGSAGRSAAMTRERTDTVHVAVQIRLVSVSTGEFVPASGEGESGLTTARVLFAAEADSFKATDIGTATRRAIRQAVAALIGRMPEGATAAPSAPRGQ